ncbi:hypothetical protein ASF84_06415 [Pseudomonas sp. Leaf127]|nr:hypothetical protein ASF84_06415 [Pseudomonas sp. Leaf127]
MNYGVTVCAQRDHIAFWADYFSPLKLRDWNNMVHMNIPFSIFTITSFKIKTTHLAFQTMKGNGLTP